MEPVGVVASVFTIIQGAKKIHSIWQAIEGVPEETRQNIRELLVLKDLLEFFKPGQEAAFPPAVTQMLTQCNSNLNTLLALLEGFGLGDQSSSRKTQMVRSKGIVEGK